MKWTKLGFLAATFTGVGSLLSMIYMGHGLKQYKSLDDIETFDKDLEAENNNKKKEETE